MHKFDYTFLKYEKFPADFIDYIGDIKERKTFEDIRRKRFIKTFEALEQKAIFSSVIASNEIEGIRTTESRASEILNLHAKPQTHDEEEIVGYKNALKIVHENHENLELSETTILRLHKEIYKETIKQKGVYKKSDNAIYSFDALGGRELVFAPVSARETPAAIKSLIAAYNEAKTQQINDLLLIPCFILDYLCIHPFSDGNGRTSRLLTLLLYYKAGFDVGKFISFENKIRKTREHYYKALCESSATWHENPNYMPFIKYYLMILYSCYEELSDDFVGVAQEAVSKQTRVRNIVLESLEPISKKEILQKAPDISALTITNVLTGLLNSGAIKKVGQGRNTKYLRV
jgi:Fic family protein